MSAHLESLNPAQRDAAIAPAPVLILAGAGTGKTETLTRRVADLILRGEDPERLLCITFTVKAAAEMRARLSALLGPERTPRWVGTFHAMMYRLLLEDGSGVPGLKRGFAILNQAASTRLLGEIAGAGKRGDAADLAEAVSLLRNGLVTDARKLPRTAARERFAPELLARAAHVLPAYERALAEREALDFDALIAVPVMAMRADPALAGRWSARWSEILIDEYQDTNHAQHALIRLLAASSGRVFAVGDDQQSIYGWRGAEVAHIRRFQADYPAAPAPLRLEANYRSTPTILRAANAVAAQDPEAMAKTLRPADPKARPGVRIAVRSAWAPEDEGRGIVSWVQSLKRGDADLSWRECAVLVRASFVAEPILAALKEAAIPARLVREREPEPPRDVLAAIAWLRLAASRSPGQPERWDKAADDAFRRACAQSGTVGGAAFGRLRDHAAAQGLALASAVATFPDNAGFAALLDRARAMADRIRQESLGPEAALRLAAEASGCARDRYPDRQSGRGGAAWAAALHAAEQAGSVAAYCDSVALDEAAAADATPDAVPVMTVHRAKGLEFDHVALAGLEAGLWPHYQAEQHGTMPEERRLFYVGLTRARHTLRLSWLKRRRDWPGKPSPFLLEIPSMLVEGDTGERSAPASPMRTKRSRASGQ